jgi:hypothetical protein
MIRISHYRIEPCHLMIEAGKRSSTDILLMRAAAMDAGYCLDAPSEIPAGACLWMQAEGEEGYPDRITVWRGA